MSDLQPSGTSVPSTKPEKSESSVNLVPIGLKEASLDSPTFRASIAHYSEQIDIVAIWLEGIVKSASKFVLEGQALEGLMLPFVNSSIPPRDLSEAVIDHDYTLLAAARYTDGARDFWMSTTARLRKLDIIVVQPIKKFLENDVRNFKDARRNLDSLQKSFDNLVARYSAQSKSKEPSALREDAFQVHETRKLYLKASLDVCMLASQLRSGLDRLVIRVFTEQWREMKDTSEALADILGKWGGEMERVRAWTGELEDTEKTFVHELRKARRRIEDGAELSARPSRELDDYSASTVPYLGRGSAVMAIRSPTISDATQQTEKQGWMNLRTFTGKPARSNWVRRWFFVKCGIFSSLAARVGRVEESEKIGVLLCNVRPAFQEERRFCFEVKTKNNTILLQAETQQELSAWLSAFEAAKRKALEDPVHLSDIKRGGLPYKDLAFAITPPIGPDFTSNMTESLLAASSEDHSGPAIDRVSTLAPGVDPALISKSSIDINPKRVATFERQEGESGRDHASRIIQKLDLHRKSTAQTQLAGPFSPGMPGGPGITSLITTSHNIFPGSGQDPNAPSGRHRENSISTLAPGTFFYPPAPTNLSKAALILSGERGVGSAHVAGGMPGGILGNIWGSSRYEQMTMLDSRPKTEPPILIPVSDGNMSPGSPTKERSASGVAAQSTVNLSQTVTSLRDNATKMQHRKTISLGKDAAPQIAEITDTREYPSNFPWQLKLKDTEFHLLFPDVPLGERVVMAFRGTWNPNNQQEFPGTAYITSKCLYFYSHHMGLVLSTGLTLKSVSEVTAAPGRDFDYLFFHLKPFDDGDATRITIKTFLEPLRLLQQRLNWLVRTANSDSNPDGKSIVDSLIMLENADPNKSPSQESWEELNLPADEISYSHRMGNPGKDLKATIRVDGGFHRQQPSAQHPKEHTKFKLPPHPVIYKPQGVDKLEIENEFSVSPRAMFSILFGDKSAIWQLLYHERRANTMRQGPWVEAGQGSLQRTFQYNVKVPATLGSKDLSVADRQLIIMQEDHLLYVICDKKVPWHLPCHDDFLLTSKIIISHVAKSKCKLAIYSKVEWLKPPKMFHGLIARQAQEDLAFDAKDLLNVVTDQVRKLGHCSTRKVQNIYGLVGQQPQAAELTDLPPGESALKTEARRLPNRQSLAGLVTLYIYSIFCQSFSSLLTILSSLFSGFLSFLQWIYKTADAHTIILSLLLVSAFGNVFYTSADWFQWRNDRRVGNFLSRIGITPELSMTKSILINDMDLLVTNTTSMSPAPQGQCSTKFFEVLKSTAPDFLYQVSSSPVAKYSRSGIAALRLKRTRAHIGARRNDLIVALRVLNRVEREVLQAEWETWLSQETLRCRQLETLLTSQKNNESDFGGTDIREKLGVSWGEVEAWHHEYCDSCQEEADKVISSKQIGGQVALI
ncbi:MAG: SNF1-interacting protein [Cirrosporium novae-zelandiae]|nr:MAG: SNF1-interacting protein [Cirrosporium novae-zelandiae]